MRLLCLLLGFLCACAEARFLNNPDRKNFVLCALKSTDFCLKRELTYDLNLSIKEHIFSDQYKLCGVSDLKPIKQYSNLYKITSLKHINGQFRIVYCKQIYLVSSEDSLLPRHGEKASRWKRQSPRGRYRGQTQSQYLNIDHKGKADEGKAEAHAAPDSSRATVSGRSGIGQAQSQSMFDPTCEDNCEKPTGSGSRHPSGYFPDSSLSSQPDSSLGDNNMPYRKDSEYYTKHNNSATPKYPGYRNNYNNGHIPPTSGIGGAPGTRFGNSGRPFVGPVSKKNEYIGQSGDPRMPGRDTNRYDGTGVPETGNGRQEFTHGTSHNPNVGRPHGTNSGLTPAVGHTHPISSPNRVNGQPVDGAQSNQIGNPLQSVISPNIYGIPNHNGNGPFYSPSLQPQWGGVRYGYGEPSQIPGAIYRDLNGLTYICCIYNHSYPAYYPGVSGPQGTPDSSVPIGQVPITQHGPGQSELKGPVSYQPQIPAAPGGTNPLQTGQGLYPQTGTEQQPQRGQQYPQTGGGQSPQHGSAQYPQTGGAELPQHGPAQYPQTGGGQSPQHGPAQYPQTGGAELPQYGSAQYPQIGGGQSPQHGLAQYPKTGGGQSPQHGPAQYPQTGGAQLPQHGSAQYPQTDGGQSPQRSSAQYPQTGGAQLPQQGSAQYPQTGGAQSPQYGTAQYPQTGEGQSPQHGSAQYPQTGEPQSPQHGSAQYPHTGGVQLPQHGSAQYPQTGGAQSPQHGSAQYPQTGGAQLPQHGSAQYPQTGGAQSPQYGTAQYPQTGGPQSPQQGSAQYPQSGGPQSPQQGSDQYPQTGGGQLPQHGSTQYPQTGGGQLPQHGSAQYPQTGGPQSPQTGGTRYPQGGLTPQYNNQIHHPGTTIPGSLKPTAEISPIPIGHFPPHTVLPTQLPGSELYRPGGPVYYQPQIPGVYATEGHGPLRPGQGLFPHPHVTQYPPTVLGPYDADRQMPRTTGHAPGSVMPTGNNGEFANPYLTQSRNQISQPRQYEGGYGPQQTSHGSEINQNLIPNSETQQLPGYHGVKQQGTGPGAQQPDPLRVNTMLPNYNTDQQRPLPETYPTGPYQIAGSEHPLQPGYGTYQPGSQQITPTSPQSPGSPEHTQESSSSGRSTPGGYRYDGPDNQGPNIYGAIGSERAANRSRELEIYDQQPDTLVQSGPGSTEGVPQNVMDPNSISDDDDSEAQAAISQAINGTIASASSKGGNKKGKAQTQVQGSYTGTGSFSAQAQISDDDKGAESQVNGGKQGASSSAQGKGRNNKSQAQVELGSETGSLQTQAQSEGVMHSSNSQVQGSVKGGMADAQARGPGSTSSQAQIGFTPYKEGDQQHEQLKLPFTGAGSASAQSSGRTGQSQSQLQGVFKYGIRYNGAAQSGASLNKDVVFPNRLTFNKIDVFDKNNKNIDVDQLEDINQTTELPLNNEEIESTDMSETNNADHPHSDHHSDESHPPVESRRSFKYNHRNEYDYGTDKYESATDDYDETGYGAELDTEYANYDDFNQGATHQSLENARQKGLHIKQSNSGNTQHIVLGSLRNHDAEITQRNSDQRLDETRIYQPGERVPGTGGYTIPIGFTGSVKSVASKGKTYAVGTRESPSQAQTISLKPGTGKINYIHPKLNSKNIDSKNLKSLDNPNKKINDENRYVSVSKSVTGSLDSNNKVKQQYSHTYYTKSSSCGYFTFTCNIVSGANGRKKVCKPKIPTNPDGTPMNC